VIKPIGLDEIDYQLRAVATETVDGDVEEEG
jgi:hypothetical protein